MTNQDRFGLMILEMVKERDALAKKKQELDDNCDGAFFYHNEIQGIHKAMQISIRTFETMFWGTTFEQWKTFYYGQNNT